MNSGSIVISLIFLLIVFLGLRNFNKELYYTNNILAEILRVLNDINKKIKNK